MKYGFVYIWRDRKHKRYYIGGHWGTEDDGYVCSSSWMKQAYKHRPQDFKRRILKTAIETKNHLLDEEYRWLQQIKTEELGKKYYNLHNHHYGHWSQCPQTTETIIEKLKKAWTPELREETGKKIAIKHKGQHHSSDTEFKKGCVGPETKFKKGRISEKKLDIPSDFREMNEKLIEYRLLAKYYGVSTFPIGRWKREINTEEKGRGKDIAST